jgi:hypothetical protein
VTLNLFKVNCSSSLSHGAASCMRAEILFMLFIVVSSGYQQSSWHLVFIQLLSMEWKTLQNTLTFVTPNSFHHFYLILLSALTHEWNTTSSRHILLVPRLRNAIRILNLAAILNTKSAELVTQRHQILNGFVFIGRGRNSVRSMVISFMAFII